jgi:hypothetical protein
MTRYHPSTDRADRRLGGRNEENTIFFQQCYTYGISLRTNLTERTWDRAIGENKRGSSSQILPIKSVAHTSAHDKISVGVRP